MGILNVIKFKFNDNNKAIKVLFNICKSKITKKNYVEHDDIEKMIFHFCDLIKISVFVIFSILPASIIVIPLIIKLSNKFNINLLPTKIF